MGKLKFERIFLRKITFVLSIFMLSSTLLLSQSKKAISPKKKFVYEKLEDGTKILSAYIFYKGSNGWLPLEGIAVKFSAKNDSIDTKLGTIETNKEGYAILHIEKGFNIPMNEDGKTSYLFSSVANDSVKSVKSSLKMIDSNLALDFNKTDEENIVRVTATDINGEPIAKIKVSVYIKRMHSLYPIGKEKTDANGQITVESPKDIPGNTEGIINIVAKVEKDRKHGNLIVSKDIDWGVPNTYSVSEDERNLWSQSSPLWLNIAVFITFALIIVFFILAIKNVILMSKDQ